MERDDSGRDQRQSVDDPRDGPLRALTTRTWWLAAALGVTLPVWLVRYVPAQDLAQHMTVIRIMRSFRDPAFDFASSYTLALGRTSYVLFYLIGTGLAFVVGVRLAAKALIAAYLAGAFLGARALTRAIGGDERVALFSIPLLVNPLFTLGLFPFLLGLAVMLWALAASIVFLREPTFARGVRVAIMGVLLLELHPIPYMLFVLAFGAQVVPEIRRTWKVAAAAIAPSLALCARWLFVTDSGDFVRRMLAGQGQHHAPFRQSVLGVFGWMGDVFRDRTDDVLFGAALGAAAVASILGRREAPRRGAMWALAVVPASAVVVYFFGQTESGYSWPLAQRYALVAALTAIPLLRMPQGRAGKAWTVAAAVIGAAVVVNTGWHFMRFDREARGADDAFATMPPRAHVASLVFESESKIVRFYPYLHFGAYYQVDHGGVVKFSFVGFDHWPVDFRDGKYPPPGGPAASGWEWHPDRVSREELGTYFDYVVVRGRWGGDGAHTRSWGDGQWQVWQQAP